MKPYVTLLERCGVEVKEYPFHLYGWEGDDGTYKTPDELKAYALEVGAKDAAEWYDGILVGPGKTVWKHGTHADGKVYWSRRVWYRVKLFNNLELIQEATKAGWEKGAGL